jgi:thiamine pyrophosphate-dependent acetolactate synthase large subunit-like protein
MAVGLHANVGLMHATMAIYNAFCDRVPMLVLGATGPLDAAQRRPWIDWAHTATDQAALIRNFIKWDDQPHSANAAISSIVHATAATTSKPSAPVYVCLDLSLQEDEVDPKTLQFPDIQRYLQTTPPGPSIECVKKIMQSLKGAKRPLFLFGRLNASTDSWNKRISLAERYGARVLTDLKQAASFPTNHPLHPCPPSVFISPQATEMIRSADLIISFDWVDLAGTLKASHDPGIEPDATIIHVSLDSALHNGWSKDHFGLPPADLQVHADPDVTISAILEVGERSSRQSEWPENGSQEPPNSTVNGASNSQDIFMTDLANALYATVPPEEMCLVRVPLGWKGGDLRATHPLAFMGMDGGAGIASGPGQVVGTALALKEVAPKMVAVGILGDGDYLMGSSALWTAARYRLPLLVIVANNSSYFNDEVHQERVAKRRAREVDNKWIGMRLDDPAPDVHKIAEGLGCSIVSSKQIQEKEKLEETLKQAVANFREGKSVVVDVRVLPEGYSSALEKAK